MLALSSASFGYNAAAFARTSTIKAVAEGVAPDFSDKPWTCVAARRLSTPQSALPVDGSTARLHLA